LGDSDNTLEDVELRAWLRRNDAESVSVAAGCTLVGHELVNGRGRGISISADDSADHHIADLEYYEHILDEDIKSVECRCGEGQSTREVKALEEYGPTSVGGQGSQTQCPAVPKDVCAVIYSEESCGGTSSSFSNEPGVDQMRSMREWLRRNDAESVSVAAGCTLVGYEERRLYENGRGRGISISADIYADHHVEDLDFYDHILDEDLKSVDCRCGEGPSTREVSAVVGGPVDVGGQGPHCPPVPKGVCAVIYSEESCGGTSSHFTANVEQHQQSWLRRNDAESVSVAAGCTLVGFENGGGRGISVSADNNADHHVADLDFYDHILDEDIRSVECTCGEGPSTREVSAVVGGPVHVGGQGVQGLHAQCRLVPKGVCAVLYSDDSCNGRTLNVFNDASLVAATRGWLRQNDVESLSVAAGCTLVGHEAENGRGRGISISADISADHHVADLEAYEHLYDEDMRSVECTCHGGTTRDVAVVGELGRSRVADCPAVPEGTCAVVYSEEGCRGQRRVVAVGSGGVGEEPESVSVAAGCKLTGHEAGYSVAVEGGTNGKHVEDLEMFFKLHGAVRDLESFQCECN